MKLDNYTIKSQEAVRSAFSVASERSHQAVEPSHLLVSLIDADKNLTSFIFGKLGVDEHSFRLVLDHEIASFPVVSGGERYLSASTVEILRESEQLSRTTGNDFVSIEYILLALSRSKTSAGDILRDNGVREKDLEKVILELRSGKKASSSSVEDTYKSLNRYSNNLNQLSRQGKLDPVIGRDSEIRRVLQILSRRTKNNPILIGEPGVGKTAIAEGIAYHIINGQVPENIKSKEIYALDMGSLIAGAKYKGEFEERLKSVVDEVKKSEGDIILFIDEIHTLIGAGKSEGAMDAANILKPALARGELRAIGATTLNEYQKYFEKDKALERRFQKVLVSEPDVSASIAILRGLKEKYENHHKVRITDEAILSAVRLSHRYISDRFLPDKAIDLIDEASSKLRLEMNSVPLPIDILNSRIRQLEIERAALKLEKDKTLLIEKERDISILKEEKKSLEAKWRHERGFIDKIQKFKEELERLNFEADKAERDSNYNLVAEIRYGKIVSVESSIGKLQLELQELQRSGAMIREEIRSEDIAEIVSKWTGIPVTKMLQADKDKLLHLEEELHKRVVGQDLAISLVSDAVRRSRAGLQDRQKPLGSFIFVGTTGVGKTELARALSEFLFDDENQITRIDMSEYQERHSVSRLIGAPPGYVGYDEGGQLTESVRRKPYSVVLLDEIEKAHLDVFNVLLQVLDDGRLTDNKGRVVDFKNTIIIMTSNIGSHLIQEKINGLNVDNREDIISETEEAIMQLIKRSLPPEFINRVDDIVMFRPLKFEEIASIVKIQLSKVTDMLREQNIRIEFTEQVIARLANIGYDPQFGARPIKRVIQQEILNYLAKSIISGTVDKGQIITVVVRAGRIVFEN